jgi:hypothetical protein
MRPLVKAGQFGTPGIRIPPCQKGKPRRSGASTSWKENQDEACQHQHQIAAVLRLKPEGSDGDSSYDEGQRPSHGSRCGQQYDRGYEQQTQQTGLAVGAFSLLALPQLPPDVQAIFCRRLPTLSWVCCGLLENRSGKLKIKQKLSRR